MTDSFKSLKHGWLKEGVFVQLDDADVEEKESAIQEILQDTFIKANFPMDYIEDRINSLISNSFKLSPEQRPDYFNDEIQKLPEELRSYVKEWTVLIPIDNFKIDDQISIGDVIFYPSENKTNFERITNLFKGILEKNPKYSKEEKKQIIKVQLKKKLQLRRKVQQKKSKKNYLNFKKLKKKIFF